MNILYPEVPVNIVNAGISGDCAEGGLKRLERDVLSYNPDLIVVCYGLNEVGKSKRRVGFVHKLVVGDFYKDKIERCRADIFNSEFKNRKT